MRLYKVQVNENVTKTYYLELDADNNDDAFEIVETMDLAVERAQYVECHNWEIVDLSLVLNGDHHVS